MALAITTGPQKRVNVWNLECHLAVWASSPPAFVTGAGHRPSSHSSAARRDRMEPRGAVPNYGAMGTQSWPVRPGCSNKQAQVSVVNMADRSVSMHDVQEELVSIEALKERLIRRESELRYMVEDFQLCQDIENLKTELKKLQLLPDEARPTWSRQREEEIMSMVQALVDKRDILVEDLELERRREQEEDRERASSAKRVLKKNTIEPATSGLAGTQPPVEKPSLARTSLEILQYCWNSCCLPLTALTR